MLMAFERREDDVFDIENLTMNSIVIRSKVRTPQVYRVVDKLLADGFLESRTSHSGMLYRRTDDNAPVATAAEIRQQKDDTPERSG